MALTCRIGFPFTAFAGRLQCPSDGGRQEELEENQLFLICSVAEFVLQNEFSKLFGLEKSRLWGHLTAALLYLKGPVGKLERGFLQGRDVVGHGVMALK